MSNTLLQATKTFTLRKGDILGKRRYCIIDATNLIVGRLASLIANILRGKDLPTYTPHMDCGRGVIVINADKIAFSGNKMQDKVYYRHTGYPGGIKEIKPVELLRKGQAERILSKAVERMITKGPLRAQLMTHLRIYSGSNHPHEAQQPEHLNVAALNSKNSLRNDANK